MGKITKSLTIKYNGQNIHLNEGDKIELLFKGFGKDGDGTIIENTINLFTALNRIYNFADFENESLPVVFDKNTKVLYP